MRPTDARVRRQLLPARRPLAWVLASGIAGSLLLVAQAFAVAGLVVAVVGSGDVDRPAVLVLVAVVARSLTSWVGDVAAARAAALVGTDLRRRAVAAAVDGRTTAATGEISVLATRGVAAAEPFLTRYVPALVLGCVLPLVTLATITVLDPLSGLIVLVTLPLVPVFGILVGQATEARARSQWRALASLSGHFVDVMRGLPTLVAFRRAEGQADAIRAYTDSYRRRALRTLRLAFASSAVLELVATLSVALVAVTVGLRLAGGTLELRTALIVLLLAPEAYWPLRRVGAEFHAAAEGAATFEATCELLDEPPEPAVPEPSSGPLVVRKLTVVHPGRTLPALDDVSCEIRARGVTAVTGPSGAGKSTLLAVLAGLLDPSSGQIRIGEHPVSAVTRREQVAWSPQRPVFPAGTLADNLRLAAPDAPDELLWDALRRVALEERVRVLPAGLDTPMREDGLNLSAGERARIALARVVLADRPWVLLDEPTAHLDELTERIVADTVQELGRSRGVVVVAHRRALRDLADREIALGVPNRPRPPSATPPSAPAVRAVPPPPALEPRGGLGLPALLGGLASASGVALTSTAGWLIVQASYQPPVLTLLVAIVAVRTFGLARPVLRYVERLRSHEVALHLLGRRRVEVYDAVVPLTPGALGRRRGDVLAAIVDDVDSVLDQELRVRLPIRGFAVVTLLCVTVAALLAPGAALVVVATAAGGALAFAVARAGAARVERRVVRHRAALSEAVVDAIESATELSMWQAGTRAVRAVVAASDRLERAVARAAAWLGGARALTLTASGAGVAAMALVTAPLVDDGTVSGPVSALLVLLPMALGEAAVVLPDAGALGARTRAAANRLADLEARPPAVRGPDRPVPVREGGRIRLDEVGVAWDGGPSLPEVSLDLAPGDRVGVVGPSGSGKSTMASLLLRFIDPTSGRLTLSGVDLQDIALDDVRARVGLVDDDPHIFATTLAENVRLARPAASDEDVERAVRAAGLETWLDALPDGLGTWLGDGHAQVSGGERARIAVARSLLADQPVLVLDEPTAHLDHATAELVTAAVLRAATGRSLVWMTHEGEGLDRMDHVLDLGVSGRGLAFRR